MRIEPINSNYRPSFKMTETERKVDKINYLDSKTYETREWGMLGLIAAMASEQINKKGLAWLFLTGSLFAIVYEGIQKHDLAKQYDKEHPIYV